MHRSIPILALISIVLGLGAQGVRAADLPPLGQTAYSADFSMTGATMEMRGTVHRTPGAERREMVLQGQRQVMLMRAAQGEMIMLLPEVSLAMRLPMRSDPRVEAAEAFARADPQAVGSETVDGEATTIYETSGEVAGRFWVTDDGIVMRARVETDEGPLVIELSDVRRGPQDPALFEVPQGIQIMDAEQMPGMTQ